MQSFYKKSSLALAYTGPIWNKQLQEQTDLITTTLVFYSGLISSAAGIIAPVYDQSMTSLTGWSTFAGIYDEFRVLGAQLEFFPANRYSKTTTTCIPGVGVIDRDSNGALASTAQALSYSSVRMLSLEDPWTDLSEYRGSSVPALKYKMSGPKEALWVTTATPTPTTSPTIKIYFAGLSTSTYYGAVVARFLVQFRGKY
jgi:hypothetical protein